MLLDKLYYRHLRQYSAFIPWLYARGKYIRATMPQIPPASRDINTHIESHIASKRLLCIGESTVAGVGVNSLKDGLQGHVAARLSQKSGTPWSWSTQAHVGFSIKQVNDHLDHSRLADHHFAVIAVGGNDSFYLTKPSTYLRELKRLLSDIRRANPGIPITVCNLPPTHLFPSFSYRMRKFLGGQTKLLRLASMSCCRKAKDEGITFIEGLNLFKHFPARAPEGTAIDDLFCDGFHPSSISYRLWGEDIADHIEEHYPSL